MAGGDIALHGEDRTARAPGRLTLCQYCIAVFQNAPQQHSIVNSSNPQLDFTLPSNVKLDASSKLQVAKIAHYAWVVGEIRGLLSLSASHQAAAQGGRSPCEAGSTDPEITKGYTYTTYTTYTHTTCINCDTTSVYYGLRSTSTSCW